MKLKNYINNLQSERAAATKEMTPESMARAKAIDLEIEVASEKLNKLAEV